MVPHLLIGGQRVEQGAVPVGAQVQAVAVLEKDLPLVCRDYRENCLLEEYDVRLLCTEVVVPLEKLFRLIMVDA